MCDLVAHGFVDEGVSVCAALVLCTSVLFIAEEATLDAALVGGRRQVAASLGSQVVAAGGSGFWLPLGSG